MPNVILSESSASISELKKNPIRTVGLGNGLPVAILNRNQAVFYCMPVAFYEQMLDALDDQDLCRLVNERRNEELIDVVFDQFT
jgi:antitoxin StbD